MNGSPTKAPHILEIIWHPPPPSLLKVNIDGAACGGPNHTACVDVFRICRGFVKDCFAIPLGVCFAFEAELVVVIHAIEYT